MVPSNPEALATERGGCPVLGEPAEDDRANTLYYWDYLHLDLLLDAQNPKSVELGSPVHDEYLFICVHQTAELWFKQIIVELEAVIALMTGSPVDDRRLGVAAARLRRVDQIVRLLTMHLDVLETMTPLDFLDFRGYLVPASGFQSVQFRLIENKFGLRQSDRLKFEGESYAATLRDDHADLVTVSEAEPTLFDRVDAWLAAMSFVRTEEFDFPTRFREAARRLHADERARISSDPLLTPSAQSKRLKVFESGIRKFDVVFDRARWDQERAEGRQRLSYDAFMAALFVTSYRDEPRLHLPAQVLTTLLEIDESFTVWRQRHALMAHRMLGRQAGTAGSGYAFLDETAKRYKAYKDLFDLSTYLLPRSALPPLPPGLVRDLAFRQSS